MGFRVNPNYSPLIGPKYLNAPRPTFSAAQKILRHLAKAEILPRICGGRGPRPDGDGERGWNINKSRSPNSAAFTCSSCVSAVSFCWMSNTDYKVQVESIIWTSYQCCINTQQRCEVQMLHFKQIGKAGKKVGIRFSLCLCICLCPG